MTATYRPSELTLVFNSIPISGFAPDTIVTIEKEVDAFTKTVGSTGATARAQNSNESGSITFILLSTSLTNLALTALHNLDKGGGNGVGAVAFKDLGGGDTAEAELAWLRKQPTMEYSAEVGTREWVIDAENLIMVAGGTPV